MKDERVFMLNALWFDPNGGEERYQDYWKLVFPMIEAVGGRKLKSFEPERALEGEFDADLIFFVEYPSFEAFKTFANSPEHHKLAFMKKEAVYNSLVVQCSRPAKRRHSR